MVQRFTQWNLGIKVFNFAQTGKEVRAHNCTMETRILVLVGMTSLVLTLGAFAVLLVTTQDDLDGSGKT